MNIDCFYTGGVVYLYLIFDNAVHHSHHVGFEFICAQSPYNMRGLLVGIFFSIQGLFSLLSVLLEHVFKLRVVYTYPFLSVTGLSCAFWYYVVLGGISVLGLVAHLVVAHRYKRRQRDSIFNDVNMIEEYFTPRTEAPGGRNRVNIL